MQTGIRSGRERRSRSTSGLSNSFISDFPAENDIIDEEGMSYVRECQLRYDFNHEVVCEAFQFDHNDNNLLIFFTQSEVIKFRYSDYDVSDHSSMYDDEKDSVAGEPMYVFRNGLNAPPRFGVFNTDQTKFIVTSKNDVLFADISD